MGFLKVNEGSIKELESMDSAEYAALDLTEEKAYIPVLSDAEYKEVVKKNYETCVKSERQPREVPTYHNYSTSRDTSNPRGTDKFPLSYTLACFLMSSFNLKMSVAYKVTTILNSFNKRNVDRTIIYRDTPINPKKIPANVRSLFSNEAVISEKFVPVDACVVNNLDLVEQMKRFINCINNLSPSTCSNAATHSRFRTIEISVDDFLSMSVTGMIRVLSQTVRVKRKVLYVALNMQKDYGNLGREYHLLTSVSRDDRSKITNLYGYDFESALQTIVLSLCAELKVNLPYGATQNYVTDKKNVRKYVVDKLGVSTDIAKKVITAAYQGGRMKGIKQITGLILTNDQKIGMQALYEETQLVLFGLLPASSKNYTASQSILGLHMKAACWYAAKRTKKKYELTDDFTLEYYNDYVKQYGKSKAYNFVKSYVFYLWTYFEGKARKILESHLDKPISLHDAAYSQSFSSFKLLNVKAVEAEILQKIGIPLKLGKA
jgi:hypothetical protein